MKKLLSIILLLIPLLSFSQNCDCESNFKWLKETFEKNDAGFSYSVESKGRPAYENHSEKLIQKTKNITDAIDCAEIMREWLTFFRSAHHSISIINQKNDQNNSETLSNKEIVNKYKNSEKLEVDLIKFTKYLESKKTIDYEGVWVSEPYKIGIKKIKDTYIGFIIEADGIYWTKGQVKLKINSDNSSIYYMRDHSKQSFENTELLGKNYIQTGFVTLKRITPKIDIDPKFEQHFKSILTNKPYFEKIDEKTNYLRIPSFIGSEKKIIDSVILANKEIILKTPNLIIDIRNNGGGSDRSYNELLPILYTNPIRTVGVEYYSTDLNNKRMLDFINDPKYGFDEDEKQWARRSYDKLSKNLGDFVNLNQNEVSVKDYDEVHQYPKKIGIIINENNGSTAEQLKQSKKVKLYGTTTMGVLDISNMYYVKSPCEEFELGYSLTRSMRIPGFTIDDKGIQPDYYIDKSISKYEWIKFVKKSLNE